MSISAHQVEDLVRLVVKLHPQEPVMPLVEQVV
jgi:hypothetical protein